MKKLVAEAIGTFALVFAGTGAITINDVSGGTVSHVGIALTFGLIVLAMIYAVGDVSGAHLNPARSFAPALVAWRLDHLWIYLTAPVLGAVGGVWACRVVHEDGCCRRVVQKEA